MEWTTESLRMLIRLYEERQILYNTKHNLYNNRRARTECLSQIADKLTNLKPGITVNDVKQKINSLRTHFSAELKKVKAPKGKTGIEENCYEPYEPTVWWFSELQFLIPHVKPRISKSSLAKIEKTDQSEESTVDFLLTDLAESQQYEDLDTILSTSSEDAMNSPPKRRRNQEDKSEIIDLIDAAISLLKTLEPKDKFPLPIEQFLNYLGSELQTMCEKDLAEAKQKILQEVFTIKYK